MDTDCYSMSRMFFFCFSGWTYSGKEKMITYYCFSVFWLGILGEKDKMLTYVGFLLFVFSVFLFFLAEHIPRRIRRSHILAVPFLLVFCFSGWAYLEKDKSSHMIVFFCFLFFAGWTCPGRNMVITYVFFCFSECSSPRPHIAIHTLM